jgi:hypothetical protein
MRVGPVLSVARELQAADGMVEALEMPGQVAAAVAE